MLDMLWVFQRMEEVQHKIKVKLNSDNPLWSQVSRHSAWILNIFFCSVAMSTIPRYCEDCHGHSTSLGKE